MSKARYCAVRDCRFEWLGGYALRLDNDSQHIEFTGNDLGNLGQGGVMMVGNNSNHPHDNIIAGNVMRHLGLVYKHVAGVYVITGDNNVIAHNTISDVTRYAIAMKSFDKSSSSHDNIVEYNDIRRTNLETNDTGAIETLGRDHKDSGNVIRHNLILDTNGMATDADGKFSTPYFSWGVYLDDYSSGTFVYGNIIARTDYGAINVHGGKNNTFENNIFVDGNIHQIRLQPRDEFMKGNRFARNILAYSRPESDLVYSWQKRLDQFSEWDYNLYWLKGADLSQLERKNTFLGTFADWRKSGFDAHSKVADPLFVDPAHDDYRLQPDSPAFKLGFKPIPVEKIGANYWRKHLRHRIGGGMSALEGQ
jgi:parallel beta-helix repeat protein